MCSRLSLLWGGMLLLRWLYCKVGEHYEREDRHSRKG